MIEKIKGTYYLTCDICYRTLENFDTFDQVLESAKFDGWVIKKICGEWFNYCKDCKDIVEFKKNFLNNK